MISDPSGVLRVLSLCFSVLLISCGSEKASEQFRPRPEVILRIHGSNTVGSELAPLLAAQYLRKLGADSVRLDLGATPADQFVSGRFGREWRAIEVHSYGSNTGFSDLAWNKCDIGMSSKPIDDVQHNMLAAKGDMRSGECEHVIGLDGIAIIVHPDNPLHSLSYSAVRAIFTGEVLDWASLEAGFPGLIEVHSRDFNSGTYDMFESFVLTGTPLAASAMVENGNATIARKVASNPLAIGYVPVSFIANTKALQVRVEGAVPLPPSKLNILTEDYPFTRRLFLYTAKEPANPQVKSFLDFVHSDEGQLQVEAAGFIAQILRLSQPEVPAWAPADYRRETQDALRVSLSIRFKTGSWDLENKSEKDLHRLVRFLDEQKLRTCRVKLLGFTDALGSSEANIELSRKRAWIVARFLSNQYGIRPAVVQGYGSALPLAANDTEMGRAKNRRIEVWLRCDDRAPLPKPS